MILSIIGFIIILGVLVFVHELGHFLVAKWSGMRVDEFSIGFPPRLWSKQKGETVYSINLLPLGGYVKIHGESGEGEDDDPRSFSKQPVWKRILVVIAGVLMNFLFAFVLLTLAFSVGFVSVGQNLEAIPGAQIKESKVVVVEVQPKSAAEAAGIQPGDVIAEMAGGAHLISVETTAQVQEFSKQRQAEPDHSVAIKIERNGTILNKQATLATSGPALGVQIDAAHLVQIPWYRTPGVAIREIGLIAAATWDALKGFADKLFIHAQLDQSVSGPVGIYKASSSALHQGAIATTFLVIILSINLALLNILPIPALDGGKLLFLVIELIFRRKIIAERVENTISLAGMALLIGLIILITIKDIISLF